jgi:predicted nucleic acid-binding protein
MRRRYVLDASMMASVLNMDDPNHQESYWFFKNLHDADAATWVVPGLIFFELQATRARRFREKRDALPVYGRIPLYFDNCEIYEVTPTFLQKVWDLDLYRKFDSLKGADLLYACIAHVEHIPLVTQDRDFDRHTNLIEIVRPGDVPNAT